MTVRIALLCAAICLTGCEEGSTGSDSGSFVPTAEAADPPMEIVACPVSTLLSLQSLHQESSGEPTTQATAKADSVFCDLARDALCTSTPDAAVCKDREPVGAYGGYYLSRHLMPIVAGLRAELLDIKSTHRDSEYLGAGLLGVSTILDLLDPGLSGCGVIGFRTWCTRNGQRTSMEATHRYAIAHLASEIVRLLVQCQQLESACPIPIDAHMHNRISLWFDLLTWDHVLLEATPIRNGFTRNIIATHRFDIRLRELEQVTAAGQAHRFPFLFQAEGRVLAVAANLLAIDTALKDGEDPRARPLSKEERAALLDFVNAGVHVLATRITPTEVFDFSGQPRNGAMFDAFAWDSHPYRRFSGIDDTQRPFTVHADPITGELDIQFAGEALVAAQGSGLDSGHYRRLVWLYYSLRQSGDIVDEDWIDEDTLRQLANQYAYAIYLHPCHSGQCVDIDPQQPPRFANYASGINGWYRLTVEAPCKPGVPPSGFSAQMLLSENLWWAQFNPDIEPIWQALDAALVNTELLAPSSGDAAPCGPHEAEPVWHRTYHEVATSEAATDRYYLAAFKAMQRWAVFTPFDDR